MTRFIVLSTPAFCQQCGGFIEAGRPAAWYAGTTTCIKCYIARMGEAPVCDEEKRILESLMAENTNPAFEAGINPKPPRRRRGED